MTREQRKTKKKTSQTHLFPCQLFRWSIKLVTRCNQIRTLLLQTLRRLQILQCLRNVVLHGALHYCNLRAEPGNFIFGVDVVVLRAKVLQIFPKLSATTQTTFVDRRPHVSLAQETVFSILNETTESNSIGVRLCRHSQDCKTLRTTSKANGDAVVEKTCVCCKRRRIVKNYITANRMRAKRKNQPSKVLERRYKGKRNCLSEEVMCAVNLDKGSDIWRTGQQRGKETKEYNLI